MKTTAYIRVSTDKQDVDNQRLEILALANEKKLGLRGGLSRRPYPEKRPGKRESCLPSSTN